MGFSVAVALRSDFHLSESDGEGSTLGQGQANIDFLNRTNKHFIAWRKQDDHINTAKIVCWCPYITQILTSWLPALANGQTPPGGHPHIPTVGNCTVIEMPTQHLKHWAKASSLKKQESRPAAMLGNTLQKSHYQNRSSTQQQQLQIFESIPVSWMMIACNQTHHDVKGKAGVLLVRLPSHLFRTICVVQYQV